MRLRKVHTFFTQKQVISVKLFFPCSFSANDVDVNIITNFLKVIVFQNKNTLKLVANLFNVQVLDHQNATFIFIVNVHQTSGFCHAMKAQASFFNWSYFNVFLFQSTANRGCPNFLRLMFETKFCYLGNIFILSSNLLLLFLPFDIFNSFS